jgi:hypothetical protein
MSKEAITKAIDQLRDPDVRVELRLASSPEVRRAIIGSIPAVRELVEIGSEASPEVLALFEREESVENDELIGVALYLLQRVPTREAARPLARFLKSDKLTVVNADLAAHAFLLSAGIESVSEDPFSLAVREADNFK